MPLLLGTILRTLAVALVVYVMWSCPLDCEGRIAVCQVLEFYHQHFINVPMLDAKRIFLHWIQRGVCYLYHTVFDMQRLEPAYLSELHTQ
jgi:hypothetical protein